MASPLRVPPESLWPTGDFPHEGFRQETPPAPAQQASTEVTENYRPAPPPPTSPVATELNHRDLEAERQLWASMAPAAPALRQVTANGGPSQIYHLPLGKGKRAEVSLFGEISAADLDLLTKYLRLTARFQGKNVEVPAVAVNDRRARR